MKDAGELEGFRICSIVKETGIDDEGLNEFATEYFPYETYKDQALTFYNSLGSGKISIGYNPFAMIKFIMESIKRTKELGIKSYNTKGEDVVCVTCSHFSAVVLPSSSKRLLLYSC